jgi:hypothetical protein
MMTNDEIEKIALPLLSARFKNAGFRRTTVESEEDFDGSTVLRITAYFDADEVSSDQLIDALHDIRSALLEKGEERFVFLNSKSPRQETIDEDVE